MGSVHVVFIERKERINDQPNLNSLFGVEMDPSNIPVVGDTVSWDDVYWKVVKRQLQLYKGGSINRWAILLEKQHNE